MLWLAECPPPFLDKCILVTVIHAVGVSRLDFFIHDKSNPVVPLQWKDQSLGLLSNIFPVLTFFGEAPS